MKNRYEYSLIIFIIALNFIGISSCTTSQISTTNRTVAKIIPATYTHYPTYTVIPESEHEVTKLVIITNTMVPTITKTNWREPIPIYTSLPTTEEEKIPSEIIERAPIAGMEPFEVIPDVLIEK